MIPKTQTELEKKILSLIGKPIKIAFPGPQGIGNTWQKELGIMVNNRPVPDWHEIEIKALSYKDGNIKDGSSMSLGSKTPDWTILKRYDITESSFFHQVDYGYKYAEGSLFFTKRLRYVVSSHTHTIDWYVVSKDLLPTEPYSQAPAKRGKHVFSWRIEDVLGKVEKMSITLVKVEGQYPNGTITPIRSYIIEALPDKYFDLLSDGSVRYEVRRGIDGDKLKKLWEEVKAEAITNFPDYPTKESVEWADKEFKSRGGEWHDHGTGFRLNRPILNSLLTLKGELLKPGDY